MSFTVKLNGSNYISEKTEAAFEEALQDNQQVRLQDNGSNGATPTEPTAATEVSSEPTTAQPTAQQTNYTHVLESLERGLAQSYDHQKQTLQVHEQYLHNQGDYSKIFSDLMQQQNALFANGNGSPERLQAALKVLEKLSRSIDQFHEHQAQTLNVHDTFLSQQADYTRAFVQLLQQQCDAMLNGNGNGNGGHATVKPQHINAAQPTPTPIAEPPAVSLEPAGDTVKKPTKAEESDAPSTDDQASHTSLGPVSTRRQGPPIQGPSPSSLDAEALTTSLLDIVSDKTGYPAEMLELDMDMEADLGIDSIKRVEILSALQDEHPDLPEIETEALAELRTLGQIIEYTNKQMDAEAPRSTSPERQPESPPDVPSEAQEPQAASAAGPALDTEALTKSLLDIVSDKTGYPAEMLELDMDMEADLGIDSIKRVEILSALQDKHPGLPDVEAEALAELRTLGQITEYMEQEGTAGKKA